MQHQDWVPSARASTSFRLHNSARPRRSTEVGPGGAAEGDDEAELIRAALEEVPEQERTKKVLVAKGGGDGSDEDGDGDGDDKDGSKRGYEVLDLPSMGKTQRRLVVGRAMATADQDNEKFLQKYADRLKRVGVTPPKIEIRYKNVTVDAKVHVGSRALPTLTNDLRNMIEDGLSKLRLMKSTQKPIRILRNVSGAIVPGRMTLLLGLPGAGKSTLLQLLAGRLHRKSGLKISGDVTYNGETFDTFLAERTAAYVDETDEHIAKLTVQETMDFSAWVQGTELREAFLRHVRDKEKEQGIRPDPSLDAFAKGQVVHGRKETLSTEFILRVLGLDVCRDTNVGDGMTRGVSGGQKKRVTCGEMVVGPKTTLFLDEISTGLDSSTTFLIVKCMRNFVHLQQATVMMALLQPQPEVYDLFDEVLLLANGCVVYHGPREDTLKFFEAQGFALPERKGVPDFLQEVCSKKDQEQYWSRDSEPYRYVSAGQFAVAFEASEQGRAMQKAAETEYQRPDPYHEDLEPLIRRRYAVSGLEAFKACMWREIIIMKRNAFVYIFRLVQTGLLAIVAATLLIRPILKHDTPQDGMLFISVPFAILVGLMMDNFSEMAITIDSLEVFHKQRASRFYPAWAFALPTSLLRIPYSFIMAGVSTCIVYYVMGFDPNPGRFFSFWFLFMLIHQFALGLFRIIAALTRTLVLAYAAAWLMFLIVLLMGGFILNKDAIHPWWIGAYWTLPMQYLQNGLAVNEFTGERWKKPNPYMPSEPLWTSVLNMFNFRHERLWVWIAFAVVGGWVILINIMLMLAFTILRPISKTPAVVEAELDERHQNQQDGQDSSSKPESIPSQEYGHTYSNASNGHAINDVDAADQAERGTAGAVAEQDGQEHQRPAQSSSRRRSASYKQRGSGQSEELTLPFEPLNFTFHHIYYSVDLPSGMDKSKGAQVEGTSSPQLELLKDVGGAFRPSILSCLMGASGAGKTCLLDVLSGRKTTGKIRGEMKVNGFDKDQGAFARVCGYVEQFDIHSPANTVYEALRYSAEMRLIDIDKQKLKDFVDQVIRLAELEPLKDSLVGLPGVSGLSVEQRKRLTIAVELVANPSVIFMDEPTSGLDARAAAIVMRTVRNTVDTGRTVTCTIHQPSIDIFESFDELLLLKRGGRVIYFGTTGHDSQDLIKYFQGLDGVPKIKEGINPATWMLEISTNAQEQRLGMDFADAFADSELAGQQEKMIEDLKQPKEGTEPLKFGTKYSRNLLSQFQLLMQKQLQQYWRMPAYNSMRLAFTCVFGLVFGSIYWRIGEARTSVIGISDLAGALLLSSIFLGTSNASTVQPIISIERSVFYRERASGYYAVYPFVLASTLVEIPYVLVQSTLYSFIVYFMVYFFIDAGKFFWFLCFTFLTLLYFTLWGILAVALSPNTQVSAVLSSGFYTLWFLFAGFIVPRPRIKGWWVWYYYLDPLTYTVYGLLASQLGDDERDMLMNPMGETVTVSSFLVENYLFHHYFVGYAVLVLCAFCIVFHGVTFLAVWKLNFLKR